MAERATVWDETWVKARKRHTCDGCRESICVGTVHVRIGRLFEGSWDTVRVHLECHELARRIARRWRSDEGLVVVEDLRGQLADIGPDEDLLRAWVGLRRARLREQRGRPNLCENGAPPIRGLSVAFSWAPCDRAEVYRRDRWGQREVVRCAAEAA